MPRGRCVRRARQRHERKAAAEVGCHPEQAETLFGGRTVR
jgi:hypothetical protein